MYESSHLSKLSQESFAALYKVEIWKLPESSKDAKFRIWQVEFSVSNEMIGDSWKASHSDVVICIGLPERKPCGPWWMLQFASLRISNFERLGWTRSTDEVTVVFSRMRSEGSRFTWGSGGEAVFAKFCVCGCNRSQPFV